MFSCTDFLRDFSDYRDGLLSPAQRAIVETHLAGCPSCARYARVVEQGVEQLKALPPIEPSEDFLPRLQNRLYAIEDGYALPSYRTSSAASAGFVVAIAALISAAAWLPLIRPRTAVVELPAVVAAAPQSTDTLHSLFRAGPLLTSRGQVYSPYAYRRTLFSEYTPLRTQSNRTGYNSR